MLTRATIVLGVLLCGGIAGWLIHGAANRTDDVSTISQYKDWRLSCAAIMQKNATCQLSSDVIEAKSHTTLAQLVIGREADRLDSNQVLLVTVPLAVALLPGMGLQFGSATKTYQYTTCVPIGCVVTIPVDDKLIASLSGTEKAALVVTKMDGKVARIPLSLDGFRQAHSAQVSTDAERNSWWKRFWS